MTEFVISPLDLEAIQRRVRERGYGKDAANDLLALIAALQEAQNRMATLTLENLAFLKYYIAEEISSERLSELLGVNVAEVMWLTDWISNIKARVISLEMELRGCICQGQVPDDRT